MQIDNVTWTETQDHAKWAVSTSVSDNVICVADINRMTSQRKRGGGALCWNHGYVATQLRNSIIDVDKC